MNLARELGRKFGDSLLHVLGSVDPRLESLYCASQGISPLRTLDPWLSNMSSSSEL